MQYKLNFIQRKFLTHISDDNFIDRIKVFNKIGGYKVPAVDNINDTYDEPIMGWPVIDIRRWLSTVLDSGFYENSDKYWLNSIGFQYKRILDNLGNEKCN